MKIEINIEDITLFAKALNNAYIAYCEVVYGISLGCEIPYKLEPLKEISYKELEKRCKCLKDAYKQVEDIEKY